MNPTQFGQTYLQYEANIVKVLRKQKIYDEDLLHDTYIALYEHSPHPSTEDFVTTFVSFYKNLYDWQNKHESQCIVCDDTEIVEKFDRPDESDLAYREKVGERVDKLIAYFSAHPLPGERNHQRACQILRLYRAGYSHVEIAKTLKIHESTVKKYFKRIIEGLKSHADFITI